MLDQRARLDPPIDLAWPCLAERAAVALCKLTNEFANAAESEVAILADENAIMIYYNTCTNIVS